ncbi:MAG: hypothetical protein R3C29_03200 [Dehalococcoidia bacterium]
MKRRLVIARALVNNPQLVLDEPTTGLNPPGPPSRLAAVAAPQEPGIVTMLLTTHYMEEAAHLCDRLVIMHRGKSSKKAHPKNSSSSMLAPRYWNCYRPPGSRAAPRRGFRH